MSMHDVRLTTYEVPSETAHVWPASTAAHIVVVFS